MHCILSAPYLNLSRIYTVSYLHHARTNRICSIYYLNMLDFFLSLLYLICAIHELITYLLYILAAPWWILSLIYSLSYLHLARTSLLSTLYLICTLFEPIFYLHSVLLAPSPNFFLICTMREPVFIYTISYHHHTRTDFYLQCILSSPYSIFPLICTISHFHHA